MYFTTQYNRWLTSFAIYLHRIYILDTYNFNDDTLNDDDYMFNVFITFPDSLKRYTK